MDENKLNQLVQQYLFQKGYNKALEALQTEAPLKSFDDVEDMTKDLEHNLGAETNNAGSEILFKYLASEETTGGRVSSSRRYLQAYQSLTDWVYSSLDIYKNELVQVLYPVFVHCYLELVHKNFKDEARKFLTKYKSQHTHFHYDEIMTLQSIQSPEIIKQNEFAQRVLNNKFVIRLSQASFELLMKFLQDSSELNLMSILNQFVNFKVFKGQPSIFTPQISESSLSFLDLETKRKVQKRKRTDEQTGDETQDEEDDDLVTRTSKKKVYWEMKEFSAPQNQMMEEDTTADPFNPLDMEQAKKKKKKTPAQLEEDKHIKELKKWATRTSPPSAPSCCLYTLFNCRDDLTAVEIAPNYKSSHRGPIVAASFSDSTIKCWNWDRLSFASTQDEDDDFEEADQQQQQKKSEPANYKSLHGHYGPVYGLNFSSDYRWLLSCSEDCTARLWNVDTSTNVVVYKGHQFAVWDAAFSSFDYLFATASHDRTARIWSTDRVTPIRILAGHLSDVECVKFHPNCNYVGTGSSDKTVRLWDVQSGECVRMFLGHSAPIHTIAFSPDGRYCASAGEDKNVFVWDLATAKSVYQFRGLHTDFIWSLDFNAEGTILASASADSTIRLFHINRFQLLKQQEEELQLQKGLKTANSLDAAAQSVLQSNNNLLKTFYTKQTPVYKVKFMEKDVLLASGPFDY